MNQMDKDILIKIRQKFCRHRYPAEWIPITDNNDVVLLNKCIKCGKPVAYRMGGQTLEDLIDND